MQARDDRQTRSTAGDRRHLVFWCALAVTILALVGWLVVGCSSDAPTGPSGSVTLEITTVFPESGSDPGAGIASVEQIDRVLARITRTSDGEQLAEQELQIQGYVARGQVVVELEGETQSDLSIQMYEGSTLTFRGYQSLTLVPGSTSSPTVAISPVPQSGIRGLVENARVAQSIAGAQVLVVEPGLSDTTNSSGLFEINVVPGVYTLRVSATGFISAQLDTVTVRDTLMTDVGVVALVPEQATGEISIVLSWGEAPRDLDSHLGGPLADQGGRFHVYFSNSGSETASPWAKLDRDETGGLGPETISIFRQFAGTYSYSVHNYTNRFEEPSFSLSSSGARVRVIKENQEVLNVSIPTDQGGTVWRVFEIDGATGDITTINTFEYVSDPFEVEG